MPPRLKLCVCRFCGKEWHEPVDSFYNHCPKCDRLYEPVEEPVFPIAFPSPQVVLLPASSTRDHPTAGEG
jgi:hypothetical protein